MFVMFNKTLNNIEKITQPFKGFGNYVAIALAILFKKST